MQPHFERCAVFPTLQRAPWAAFQNLYAVTFDSDDTMYVLYGGRYDPAAREDTGKAIAVLMESGGLRARFPSTSATRRRILLLRRGRFPRKR